MDRYTCLKESGVIIPDGDDESSSDDEDDDGDDDEDEDDEDGDRDIGGDDADGGQEEHIAEDLEEETEPVHETVTEPIEVEKVIYY
jgi:hypothetical protein